MKLRIFSQHRGSQLLSQKIPVTGISADLYMDIVPILTHATTTNTYGILIEEWNRKEIYSAGPS